MMANPSDEIKVRLRDDTILDAVVIFFAEHDPDWTPWQTTRSRKRRRDARDERISDEQGTSALII